jgi:hypothetical protein
MDNPPPSLPLAGEELENPPPAREGSGEGLTKTIFTILPYFNMSEIFILDEEQKKSNLKSLSRDSDISLMDKINTYLL